MKSSDIARLLPEVFRSGVGDRSVLSALLHVMERLHAPSERMLHTLEASFDPMITPDRFVPMLARWVDLERLFMRSAADPSASLEVLSTGTGRLRGLVARASHLSQWRGTRHGLIEFLETATGASGFAVDEQVPAADGRPRTFHIRVQVPPGLDAHRALIEQIVRSEKPAYVTCEIHFPSNGG
jgi:phage tail-like protein